MTLNGAIKLLHQLRNAEDMPIYYKLAIAEVINVLLMDTQEVKHGRWDDSKVAFHRVCSECGAVIRQDVSLVYLLECMEKVGALNYCPNCGAIMDEVSKDE